MARLGAIVCLFIVIFGSFVCAKSSLVRFDLSIYALSRVGFCV